MRAEEWAERAREELAAGRTSAALRSAWNGANQAMLQADERPMRELQTVAEALVAATEGKDREEAERLARYCGAVLDGVGGGVRSPSIIDRLFSRSSSQPAPAARMRCPECAEDIAVGAKVCRYCGYRLDG